MKDELDNKLCQEFPKLFRNRHASMQETCMCWGFAHGDGWYNIIHALCGNIQHHIDWKRSQRAEALLYNRALTRSIRDNNIVPMLSYYTRKDRNKEPTRWMYSDAEEALENKKFRKVPETVHQVVVDQVKEKFGTLRFYYHGGDDHVSGMVRMAESMSACTCEHCGVPATTGQLGGWVCTLCQGCIDAAKKRREAEYGPDED